MAYFSPYIDTEGIHIPTYQDLLDYLIDSYKRVYGEQVYLAEDSPDYQMMSIFARALDDYAALCVSTFNSRNIQYASGNALDLLLPLVAMKRNGATASTAKLELSGNALSVIPAGSKAIDENGNLWATIEDLTLNLQGYGYVDAVCETLGAVHANSGTINRIYTAVNGWNAVTNNLPATVGKDTETDAEVRNRHKYVAGAHSTNSSEAIVGSLMNLEGVNDVVIRINDTSTEDSETLIPGHSFSCVVYGGDDDEIAQTIYQKKAPGIGTYGSETVTVTDTYGTDHAIQFNRPESVVTSFVVTIRDLANYDQTLTEDIISSTIEGFVESHGIGEPLIIGQLIGMCYAAKPEIASSYVLQSIRAIANGGDGVQDVLELTWKQRVVLAENGITFQYV